MTDYNRIKIFYTHLLKFFYIKTCIIEKPVLYLQRKQTDKFFIIKV